MSTDNTFTSTLAEHPKLVGVLFALMLFLSQTGAVAAAANGVTTGP